MASITINNLNTTGSDLLNDSESYLEALSDADLQLQGGMYIYTSALSTVTTIIYWTL